MNTTEKLAAASTAAEEPKYPLQDFKDQLLLLLDIIYIDGDDFSLWEIKPEYLEPLLTHYVKSVAFTSAPDYKKEAIMKYHFRLTELVNRAERLEELLNDDPETGPIRRDILHQLLRNMHP